MISLTLVFFLVSFALVAGAQASPTSSIQPETPTPVTPPVVFEGGLYFPSAEQPGRTAAKTDFVLRYRLSQDIPLGGAVRMYLGYSWQGRALTVMRANIWHDFQLDRATAANYLTVEVPGNQNYRLEQPHAGGLWVRQCGVELHPTSAQASLRKGQELIFRIGDPSAGSPGYLLPKQSADVHFLVEERIDANTPFRLAYPAELFPRIEVGPTSTDRFTVLVDSICTPGERVRMIVQARQNADSFYLNSGIDRSFVGEVQLQSDRVISDLPTSIYFEAKDQGVKTLYFHPHELGVVRVQAHEQANPSVLGESNPLLVRAQANGQPQARLLWGNLHVHSAVGGHALGNPTQAFAWARDTEGFDFMGLSEHCSMPGGNEFDWTLLRGLDEQESRPQSFVAFVGYEWTSDRAGHRNVILKHGADAGDVFCLGDGNRTRKLLTALEGHRAIGIPHHSAWAATGPMDWGDSLTHPNQPLVEIYSWHGSSEYPGNPLPMQQNAIKNHPAGLDAYVQEALRAGFRMGFTADSDHHMARPGSNISFPERYARMGITGVWSASHDRDGVWNGLTHRRTIASTGARAIGSFEVNGHVIGQEFWSADEPQLTVSIFGTDEITELTVFRDGSDAVLQLQPNQRDVQLKWTDPNTAPGELHSYYVRAIQADGHRIWLSPIWMRRTAASEG